MRLLVVLLLIFFPLLSIAQQGEQPTAPFSYSIDGGGGWQQPIELRGGGSLRYTPLEWLTLIGQGSVAVVEQEEALTYTGLQATLSFRLKPQNYLPYLQAGVNFWAEQPYRLQAGYQLRLLPQKAIDLGVFYDGQWQMQFSLVQSLAEGSLVEGIALPKVLEKLGERVSLEMGGVASMQEERQLAATPTLNVKVAPGLQYNIGPLMAFSYRDLLPESRQLQWGLVQRLRYGPKKKAFLSPFIQAEHQWQQTDSLNHHDGYLSLGMRMPFKKGVSVNAWGGVSLFDATEGFTYGISLESAIGEQQGKAAKAKDAGFEALLLHSLASEKETRAARAVLLHNLGTRFQAGIGATLALQADTATAKVEAGGVSFLRYKPHKWLPYAEAGLSLGQQEQQWQLDVQLGLGYAIALEENQVFRLQLNRMLRQEIWLAAGGISLPMQAERPKKERKPLELPFQLDGFSGISAAGVDVAPIFSYKIGRYWTVGAGPVLNLQREADEGISTVYGGRLMSRYQPKLKVIPFAQAEGEYMAGTGRSQQQAEQVSFNIGAGYAIQVGEGSAMSIALLRRIPREVELYYGSSPWIVRVGISLLGEQVR